MSFEINPVLAGKYDALDYAPAHSIASVEKDVQSIDSRRYTQFDRSAIEAGSTTDFSFSDFIDLVNPLQHIPIVSTIYRAVAGESIHPVSRVAGDIMYGGIIGGITAVLGGIGSAADVMLEAQTGKTATGNVVALLFGDDKEAEKSTQLAKAEEVKIPSAVVVEEKPNEDKTKDVTLAATALAVPASDSPAPASSLPSTVTPENLDSVLPALMTAKAFPLNPKKLPFGGVMDNGATQQQARAMALATGAPNKQIGNTIYTGRLMTGAHAPPAAASPPPLAPSSGNLSPSPSSVPPPLPPELVQDLLMMKAINQYKSTASQSQTGGANLDIVN